MRAISSSRDLASPLAGRRPSATAFPSSAVLSGLGAFFVGLALLAEAVRWIGRPSEAIWYERAAVALLVVLLALWIFPGLRCELRRLLDRGGLVSFAASRETIEKMARALAPAERAGDLAIALRILLRERLGPITAHLWVSAPLTDRFEPAEPTGPVGLGREHPLVTELERRSGALVLSGGASRIREIVLHVACEEIAERHGLRVLLPIRHHGTLVAILGAGGTAERTLHPEDIDLLEELAAEIGPLAAGVALEERAFPPRGTDSRPIAAVAEAAGSTWLDALLPERQGDSQSAPLRLLVSVADRVCRTPGFADPLLRSLFREAAERAAEGRAPAEVRIGLLPRDRLQVELPGDGGGRIVLRLVDPLALRRGEPAPGGGDDV